MKVLVLGAGQVASATKLGAPECHEVIAYGRKDLDIEDAAALERALKNLRPDWIVNAAAYTAVDLAEQQSERATAVNDTAVGVLARLAAKCGSRLLHLSTDFVFDGEVGRAYSPLDATHPLNVYGVSKRGGELHVLEARTGIVLRTSWVYAATGKNFVLTMLGLMREKPQLSVVFDQIGSPTWASGLGGAIWALIDVAAAPGIYHWCDLGVASWYDFALAIQEEALARGLLTRSVRITPIATTEYPTLARRPAFSVLDTAATRKAVRLTPHHWRHNLRMMLDELRTA